MELEAFINAIIIFSVVIIIIIIIISVLSVHVPTDTFIIDFYLCVV